jgi:hypothetical protein
MNMCESERRRVVRVRCADVGTPVGAVGKPPERESVSGDVA